MFCLQLLTNGVSQLEALLPQVAYGNIMAEDPAALTPAHFRQLLALGQACLDYLYAIACATSKVLVRPGRDLSSDCDPGCGLTQQRCWQWRLFVGSGGCSIQKLVLSALQCSCVEGQQA